MTDDLRPAIARALRSPYVPTVFDRLAACEGYLDLVWPQLAPSVETAGFLGSALYLADTALDAVLEHYEPVLTPETLEARGVPAAEVPRILQVLDVLHWGQPQTLLVCAALAEASEVPRVGGEGRPDPRETSDRERAHLATPVRLADATRPPLPAIAEALQTAVAPDLYRAVAAWPQYLDAAWEELQHIPAYPPLRRRARALYYYARSSTRFLARPVEASRAALAAHGLAPEAIEAARAALEAALPVLATMVVHCSAMRVALGVMTPEVVRPA